MACVLTAFRVGLPLLTYTKASMEVLLCTMDVFIAEPLIDWTRNARTVILERYVRVANAQLKNKNAAQSYDVMAYAQEKVTSSLSLSLSR